MMPAKVSIVVPIYNVEAYLEKALASIQQQSYRELKVIMVNDGSTDTSGYIADQYSPSLCSIVRSGLHSPLAAYRVSSLLDLISSPLAR